MGKLKIKFSLFERAVVMQVLEQSEEITKFISNGDGFHSSVGITIVSNNRPGLYADQKCISLRGNMTDHNLDIVYSKFRTNYEAEKFMASCIKAVKELGKEFNSDKHKNIIGFGEKSLNSIKWNLVKMSKCIIFEVIGDYPTSGVNNVLTGDLPLEYDKTSGGIILPNNPEKDHQCMIKFNDDLEAEQICKNICESLVNYDEAMTSKSINSSDSSGEDVILEI